MIVNGKRAKKKKSSIGKSGDPRNPVWNEAFTFNFTQSNLQNAAIEVGSFAFKSSCDFEFLSLIEFSIFFNFEQIYLVTSGGEANAIGSVGLGPQESGLGRQHWQDMIHNARQPIALWHYLR